MFRKQASDKQTTQAPDIKAMGASNAPVDIYTLPEKFLPNRGGGSKKGKSGNKITLILIIALVAIIIGGVLVFVFFRSSEEPEPQGDQVVVDIPEIEEQPKEEQEEPPELQPELPVPIRASAFDAQDNRIATITVQLGSGDDEVAEDVKVAVTEGVVDPKVYGAIYRITPSGLSLDDIATISIEYEDTELTSVQENSLRIGFEQSLGEWRVEQSSSVDVAENMVTLEVRQLPRTRIAVISNLSDVRFADEDEKEEEVEDAPLELTRLTSTVDSDGDGLTDVEEELYGSDSARPDTDSDGYLDGDEMINLYSPLTAGTRLADTGFMDTWVNTAYGYSVLYPNTWQAQSVDGLGKVVLFSSPTTQFIQIVIEEKDADFTTIQDWYKEQVPGLGDALIEEMTIGVEKRFAIMSVDGTAVYFVHGDYIVAFSYNLGIESEADYLTTWEMMRASWVDLLEDASNEEAPSASEEPQDEESQVQSAEQG